MTNEQLSRYFNNSHYDKHLQSILFLESGKVELWDLEAGENICSTRGDDDAVTCVKVMIFLLDPPGEAMRKYLLSNSYTKLKFSCSNTRLQPI